MDMKVDVWGLRLTIGIATRHYRQKNPHEFVVFLGLFSVYVDTGESIEVCSDIAHINRPRRRLRIARVDCPTDRASTIQE